MKVCSFDAATGTTGVAIFENNKYIKSYIIETNNKIKGDEKLNQMIDLIYSVLKTEEPDVCVVEKIVVTRNAVSTRMLQELIGAIRGYCIDPVHNIKFECLAPSTWRSNIVKLYNQKPNGKKREEQKAWALDVVNNKLNIKTEDDNEADAILIGLGYIQIYGERGL